MAKHSDELRINGNRNRTVGIVLTVAMRVEKHDFALYKINVLLLQNFIVGDEILIILKCKSGRAVQHSPT